MGAALMAGFGVTVEVPGVPDTGISAITVPVPNVAVNVNKIGFCVSAGVGVACVGVAVAANTAVLLGASVGEGRD